MAAGSNSKDTTHGNGGATDSVFFSKPILNSPYEYPIRHWELDALGQPTQKIIESRRRAGVHSSRAEAPTSTLWRPTAR